MRALDPPAREHYQRDGFVVLRSAFDPGPLAAEFDDAIADAFRSPASTNVSEEAGIEFRYAPMMNERTPISLELLDRFAVVAADLLGAPVLPVRTKAVEYYGAADRHRDSEFDLASVGFACYLESLDERNGALRVVPGSHRGVDGDQEIAIATEPGDVIVFDEHLRHGSGGGATRRQWRVDYVVRPRTPAQEALTREYFAAIFSPDWDPGYDVDRYPSYGAYWLASGRAVVDDLARLGAYDAARAEEDAARLRRAR